MKLQVLVAAMNADAHKLVQDMNIRTDAVICNQCGMEAFEEFQYKDRTIRAYSFNERGVGRNRNNALLKADAEYVLFSDEDIVYEDNYEQLIAAEFNARPEADALMFNVMAVESRRTYENKELVRVKWNNYGRYPTYAMCCRLESLQKANVWFSLLFGGGARYQNGEDSLFIHDCLKKGMLIYAVPVTIGHEKEREDGSSTWFNGYNEKFFYDRGVLYHCLYGIMQKPFALRWLFKNRNTMCREIPVSKAFTIMERGMNDAEAFR